MVFYTHFKRFSKIFNFIRLSVSFVFLFSFAFNTFAGNVAKIKGKNIKTKNASESQVIQARTESGKFKARWTNVSDAIDDNSITGAKLQDNAITNSKIQNDAVTNSKIASGAVTGSKIASGAITSPKIANGALPATYVVDESGNGDYTTVSAAINALPSSGGKIYIREGTYTDSISVIKNNVLIEGSGPGTIIDTIFQIANVSNIIVKNLTVNSVQTNGIHIQEADNVSILNCTITNSTTNCILVNNSNNISIINNNIMTQFYGISLTDSNTNTKISNNTILGADQNIGINIPQTSAYNNISNNYILINGTSNPGMSIYLSGTGTTYSSITGNSIYGGEIGINGYHSYVVIAGNNIAGTGEDSIRLNSGAIRNAVNNNIVTGEIDFKANTEYGDHTFFGNIANNVFGDGNSSQPMFDTGGTMDNANQFNVIY